MQFIGNYSMKPFENAGMQQNTTPYMHSSVL